MQIVTSIILQALLLALALGVTTLRFWLRSSVERRKLTLADYLVWGGWFCALGWVACSSKALVILIDHPLDEETRSDSIDYLKTVFASCFFFDTGLYFPKASLIAFYWWLIPPGFPRLRISVYVTAAAISCCWVASLLTDLLIAPKISDNWSIENQLQSTWNTFANLIVNWVLNFATDLMLFIIPFFIIGCMKLRKRQKIGLVGVFSLGVLTMAISLARFIVYNMDYDLSDAYGNLWCTAEMCTSIIVVSLPFLKSLVIRPNSPNTTNHSNTGYIYARDRKMDDSRGRELKAHALDDTMDDEMELTFLDRRPSPALTTATDDTRGPDGKHVVMVTTDVTITRSIV
ncbi:hypothetical protein PTNB73_02838 [Pyrenophora teres f. teres]|nr:hypothetical protein HRS9139_03525 [Pyrenophora teres f. teres]KAE8845108.1 hypothetical protein PTNB85_03373 [Pyrenophora teres f. teres]KAE8846688.1 hypothetical protein HRS9122_03595 [Pyrenophora teres f. teres]KAE8865744.1 hypothetical protein PTNB29_02891 [Pyrenophora teres f. teres]KAE8871379.1 hypothetical protein PTNB73_02838 [Pyrenophora teres f. teres]